MPRKPSNIFEIALLLPWYVGCLMALGVWFSTLVFAASESTFATAVLCPAARYFLGYRPARHCGFVRGSDEKTGMNRAFSPLAFITILGLRCARPRLLWSRAIGARWIRNSGMSSAMDAVWVEQIAHPGACSIVALNNPPRICRLRARMPPQPNSNATSSELECRPTELEYHAHP